MARDYNNYDYLAVSVKSDQLNRILHCYRALGWTEVKTVDDREYYNMKYVRLRRPHKIANKDRLQYLQVRMEGAINSLVEIVNRAHLKSNAAAGGLGLLAAGLIALAVWLVIYFTSAIRVLGWVCLGVGCALIVVAVAVRAGLRRRERKVASGKIMEKLRLTQSLIEEAVSLAPAKEGVADGLDEPAAQPEANNG
ncbi:MAG TPA: hypothetical protein IAC67_05855 [Candidatus Coproplasma excrementipullorum]|nr:hypothetical protein [Candidatus Coproplasma excrementipullorum]